MKTVNAPIALLSLLVILGICAVAAPFMAVRSRSAGERAEAEQTLKLAGIFRNEGQLDRAIRAYEEALNSAMIANKRKSNVAYIIASILLNEKKDFERAHAWFLQAKFYDPESPEKRTIEEGLITCLERMGRPLDAKNKLRQATILKPDQKPKGKEAGAVVAKVGAREITEGEVREALMRMSPDAQNRMQSNEAWTDFVKSYVRREQLKNAARRAGMDKDAEYLTRLANVEDDLLAQTYYEKEIGGKVEITEAEIKLYYKEHEEDFRIRRRVQATFEIAGGEPEASARDKASTSSAAKPILAIEGDDRIEGLGTSPEAAKAILALTKESEKTAPVAVADKKYIFTATKIYESSMQPYEKVKSSIESRLKVEKRMESQEALFAKLSKADPVVFMDDRLTTTTQTTGSKTKSSPR
ncbi:MAG: hypothetical protein NTX50_10440 [Candidatus Sumerlaeota bacterium]|nr:hypothetical protein [Candidatus Sumerlaeota bacterium]